MHLTLARRLESANEVLIGLKSQVGAGQARTQMDEAIEKIEGMLGSNGASLVYAGYPYDPYA